MQTRLYTDEIAPNSAYFYTLYYRQLSISYLYDFTSLCLFPALLSRFRPVTIAAGQKSGSIGPTEPDCLWAKGGWNIKGRTRENRDYKYNAYAQFTV